jgi:5-deoxy-glucuronate isomerase
MAAAPRVLFPSSPLPPGKTGTAVEVTRARVGWSWVHFAVRQIVPGAPWTHKTGSEECCLVLLRGACRVDHDDTTTTLGPRRDVFADYPHALYLPPGTVFTVAADTPTELGDGRAPARARGRRKSASEDTGFQARAIRPENCGFEIRGGGNATRQIIDIMPPAFPADRLLVCEVFTPSGNWSSYPPHKHDTDRPPAEVKLEEVYYYRFEHPDAYGIQRLYDDQRDRIFTVRHGDVVVIREGYHPFVTAHGYDAYYLNVLAGTRRSMAARDDPRYAAFRAWPPPDPRLPLVPRPNVS